MLPFAGQTVTVRILVAGLAAWNGDGKSPALHAVTGSLCWLFILVVVLLLLFLLLLLLLLPRTTEAKVFCAVRSDGDDGNDDCA